MRYLIENNDYVIKYEEKPDFISFAHPEGFIRAVLIDKKIDDIFKKNGIIIDREEYKGNLEKCLMKLGKRLQKKWQKTKK